MRLITLNFIFLIFIIGIFADGFIEVFKWKQIDYYNRGDSNRATQGQMQIPKKPTRPGTITFPNQIPIRRLKRNTYSTSRQPVDLSPRWNYEEATVNTSSYIPYNNVPMGVTHYKNKLFITMPRRRSGIPSTLNYIDLQKDGNNPSPKLYAYPNFDTNYLSPDLMTDNNRLVSVYRTTVDECQRLWFIDTGILEYPNDQRQLKQPAIWIIDLNTDRVTHRFEMPESIVNRGNGLASITIDVNKNDCGNAFAYIPDLMHNRLYVYSLHSNDIWSFSHNYFNFDPLAGDLNIGGQSFRWNDGIFSITLGTPQPNGTRNAYFHAMASNNEFVVSTDVLKNRNNAARSDHLQDFRLLGMRGERRQSTMHEYDPKTGIIFYNEIQRNGIGCWNSNKPFTASNHATVHEDSERMIYPCDLTIDEDGVIWVFSNSMPIFIYSELDTNIYNFRVWKQNVFKAARNTACE